MPDAGIDVCKVSLAEIAHLSPGPAAMACRTAASLSTVWNPNARKA